LTAIRVPCFFIRLYNSLSCGSVSVLFLLSKPFHTSEQTISLKCVFYIILVIKFHHHC